jgi:dTDP-4-amino-4,6-dideoxygalactose transaminase
MAFALGLRLFGLQAGKEVLVPAYSSRSMITPVLLHGAQPVFYRLCPDLSVDLEDLASKLTKRSHALLAVNYFGFSQDWAALRRFADETGIVLVEDCAHALFGAWRGTPLGSFGDFAIASLTKFLPVWDGGLLAVNADGKPTESTRSQPLRTQFKAIYNLFEDAAGNRRNPALYPLLALANSTLGERRQHRDSSSAKMTPVKAPVDGDTLRRDISGEVPRHRLLDAPTTISRLIARTAARPRIVERRRHAYKLYEEGLAGVPGCAMPFRMATEEVPYMVPVWVDDLAYWHQRWLDKGLPMQRFAEVLWPDLPAEACRVATELRAHLVQFPCHQDLDDAQIHRIIESVRTDLCKSRRVTLSEPV